MSVQKDEVVVAVIDVHSDLVRQNLAHWSIRMRCLIVCLFKGHQLVVRETLAGALGRACWP